MAGTPRGGVRDDIFAGIEVKRQDDLRAAERARTNTLGILAQISLRVLRRYRSLGRSAARS